MFLTVLTSSPRVGHSKNYFSDMPVWGGESIDYLLGLGAIEGYPDGTFRPYQKLTRAHAAKILAISLKLNIKEDATSTFIDAREHWAAKYIAALQTDRKNIIKGYPDGTFRPNEPITRAQLSKMVVEAYDLQLNPNAYVYFKDMPDYYATYILVLGSLGIVQGPVKGEFRPYDNVTRVQMAAFIHRTEAESVRLPVQQKESLPSIKKVTVYNETKFEVTFNAPVKEDIAKEIESSGKRFAVYLKGQSIHSQSAVQSQMISFNETYTKAIVILAEDTIQADANYSVALLGIDNLSVAEELDVFTPVVLKKGTKQPKVIIDDKQEKIIFKFHEKMTRSALEAKHYTIYGSNQLRGNLEEYIISTQVGDEIKGNWVDATEKTEVEFLLNKHPNSKKFLVGETFKVLVSEQVETEKGYMLSETERVTNIQTPSLAEARPKAKIARIVNHAFVITFDKHLSEAMLNPRLITIKKPNGHTIPVQQILLSTTDHTLSEKEIKLIVDPSYSLETTLSYSIELPANLVVNTFFPNASNSTIKDLMANAQKDIEITSVTAKVVQQTSDRRKANLHFTFDQRVDIESFKKSYHEAIKIKDAGLTYQLIDSENIILDDQDITGKTILIQDVEKSFRLVGSTEEKGFKPQSGKVYKSEFARNTIKTENGEKVNQEMLSSYFKGISISEPKIHQLILVSASEINVYFQEEIDARNLQAHHVKVKGYEQYRNGNFTETPILLTGDSQLKLHVTGKRLTITPANDQVKFVTYGMEDILTIQGDVMKGQESGVVNSTILSDDYSDSLHIIDRAVPVMIGGKKVDDRTLNITYSEPVIFKGSSSTIQAAQFSVENATKNAYGSAATLLSPDEIGMSKQLYITFNKPGTFQSDMDLEKVKLIYTQNNNAFVKDSKGNAQNNQVLNGIR